MTRKHGELQLSELMLITSAGVVYSKRYLSYIGVLSNVGEDPDILIVKAHLHHNMHKDFTGTRWNDSGDACKLAWEG